MSDQANVFPLHAARDPLLVQDKIIFTEQALLGSLLMNSVRGLPTLPETFSASHYLDGYHRDIHEAIVALGSGADALTVGQALGSIQEHSKYLASLTAAGSWMMAAEYARSVTEAHYRRELMTLFQHGLDDAREGSSIDKPAASIIAVAMAQLDALITGTQNYTAGRTLDAALDEALDATGRAARGEILAGRSTGMPSVDEVIGGLENGTFNVLGARPGMGKTALACQWAIAVARKCKEDREGGVLGFSLEMKATALARRILAEASRISVVDLKRGRVDGRLEQLSRVRHELAGLPLFVEDAGGQNIATIRQKARAAQRRYGRLALIWVDHIHIVKPDEIDRRNGGTQSVGRISNALRDLSKEFDCPVLALAQLNRSLLGRDDKRPNLGDLRAAGDIEQDADTIAFLHREEAYLSKSEPNRLTGESTEKHEERKRAWDEAKERARGKAELIFEKVRDGATKTLDLRFDGETTSFSEPHAEPHYAQQTKLDDYSDKYQEPAGFWK